VVRAAGGSGARQAVSFLTPIGGAATPGPGALAWFPVVGALIGGAVGAVWWAASRVWPPGVAAAIAVAADLALTGLLHVDGLCDSADGLLPPLDRSRRLAVMAAPDVGAFGVAVAVAVLLLRWVALAALHPAPFLVAGLWAASRAWMAGTITLVPYARGPEGLASAFRTGARPGAVIAALGLGAGAALAAGWRPVLGPASVLAGFAAAAGVIGLGWRRLGGFTGDVLGAAGVVGETVGLLVACGHW